MDELTPNPDGCQRFEPNQFKKEKCKNCGRQWQEHKGVITEELVNQYAGAKKKLAEDKAAKEAEAKAKLKAKAVAKKKAQQAVEDEWLFDGAKTGEEVKDDDSDDDMGFRMFTAGELSKAPLDKPPAQGGKPLKITNLIDFGECDVMDESMPMDRTPSMMRGPEPEPEAAFTAPVGACGPASPSGGFSGSRRSGSGASLIPQSGGIIEDFNAHMEIENLRTQLSQANEMKNIEIEIVRDEVDEKKKIIEELKKKMSEEAQRTAELDAELQRLREAASSAPASADATAPAPVADDVREELERLRAEVQDLRVFKSEQEAKEQQASSATAAPASLAPEVVSLISECMSCLAEDTADGGATIVPAAEVETNPGSGIQRVHEMCLTARDEHRRLANQLAEAEKLAESLRSESVASAAKAEAALEAEAAARAEAEAATAKAQAAEEAKAEALAVSSSQPLAVLSTSESGVEEQAAEAQRPDAKADAVGRQAAQALREVRLNAERQLAWITKRIKLSNPHQAAISGSQNIDPVGSGC